MEKNRVHFKKRREDKHTVNRKTESGEKRKRRKPQNERTVLIMKRYNHYLIFWWDFKKNKMNTKWFKMEKPAKKFAIKLADDENTAYRNFTTYDDDFKLIDEFTF